MKTREFDATTVRLQCSCRVVIGRSVIRLTRSTSRKTEPVPSTRLKALLAGFCGVDTNGRAAFVVWLMHCE